MNKLKNIQAVAHDIALLVQSKSYDSANILMPDCILSLIGLLTRSNSSRDKTLTINYLKEVLPKTNPCYSDIEKLIEAYTTTVQAEVYIHNKYSVTIGLLFKAIDIVKVYLKESTADAPSGETVKTRTKRTIFYTLTFICSFTAALGGSLGHNYANYFTIKDPADTALATTPIDKDLLWNYGKLPTVVSGLLPVEFDTSGIYFAWGIGPRILISFVSQSDEELTINFKMSNPLDDQVIKIIANNDIDHAATFHANKAEKWLAPSLNETFKFYATKGINYIVFNFSSWNCKNSTFAPNDDRKLAAAFLNFTIKSSTR